MTRDVFAGYHPVINFSYLCAVIFLGLLVQHPIWVMISFAGALSYAMVLGGRKALRFFLTFALPIILLTAILNPLFVHQGVTILFYFRDNPITLEAAVYGITRGAMFGTGLLWFYCYQHLMTGDKFMYLFGKVIPAGSLIFSMVLGFIPRFHARMKIVSDAQKCIGQDVTDGGIPEKVRHGIKVLSIMTTWSLENAIDTSDSMKSRGYGLRNRSSFVPYRLSRRDGLMGLLLFGLVVLAGIAIGAELNLFVCYPALSMAPVTGKATLLAAAYGLLCFIPVLLNLTEALKWKRIESAI